MDEDLESLDREALIAEAKRLRAGVRACLPRALRLRPRHERVLGSWDRRSRQAIMGRTGRRLRPTLPRPALGKLRIRAVLFSRDA